MTTQKIEGSINWGVGTMNSKKHIKIYAFFYRKKDAQKFIADNNQFGFLINLQRSNVDYIYTNSKNEIFFDNYEG